MGLPILFLAVAVPLAWIERGVSNYGHLQVASAPGDLPRLQAQMLGSLSELLLEVYPERAESNRFAGVWAAERGDFEESRAYFARAVEIDPRDPRLLFWYGQVLVLLGDHPQELQRVARILAQYFPAEFDALEQFDLSLRVRRRPVRSGPASTGAGEATPRVR